MLSIRLITAGGEDYYLNLAAEDYYLCGGEPPGKWCGKGADALGLTGTVDSKVFRRVFRGYHPSSGAAMVQNAGHSDRQCAWDFTFSAPKSVSIVWSVAPAEVRLLIQKFQQMAVEATLRYAEQNLVFSRAGKGGTEARTVGLVVATWEHGTNRLLQAQLHTHALPMNLGVAADSKVRAIYSKLLFRYKKVLGACYRAQLAHLLESQLGFSLIRKGDSFEIAGVPDDLIRINSKRRRQILAYLRRKHKDQDDAVAAAEAALKTRRTKKDIPPRSKLFERWREENSRRGFTEASIAALPRPRTRNTAEDLAHALASAKDRMGDRYSHFSFREFLFEVLLEAPKWGLSPEAIPQAARDYLATATDIIKLRPIDGDIRYTTRAILKRETRLLRHTIRLRKSPGAQVDRHRTENILSRFPGLRADQAGAVRHLTRRKGRLRILCGKAGTGKTTTLRVARKIWLKHGYRVIGMTFTGKAARVLQNATGIETDTIHRRLADHKPCPKRVIKHHLRQFVRALMGKPTYRRKSPKPIKIDKKTIVVVDEAGMVNTRHMRMIMQKVQQGGGTLVPSGDPSQLPPVEGPAPFRSICRRAGFVELTQICRQEDQWAREAVDLFSQGKTGEAIRLYAAHRLVTVRDDRDEAMKARVLDWTAVGLTTPEQAAVLVATNHESEMANHLLQAKRLEAGCLDARHSIEIRDEDPAKGIVYVNRVHVGDRILFTRIDRRYGVENGAVGTVIALKPSLFRKAIAVKLDDGRRAIIPVNNFPHMRLGYAYTTHKSQGMTLRRAFVLVGGPMQDLPISYVQASRASHETRFYTEKALLDEYLEEVEGSPLAKQMAQTPDLTLASDLLPNANDDQALATPLSELQPANAAPTTHKKLGRQRRDKIHPRLRKPAQSRNPDLTYGMAQVDAFETARRLRQASLLAAPISQQEPCAIPNPAIAETQHSAIAMQYLYANSVDSHLELDTSSNVPPELILDAHFVDSALQAEVRRHEEEVERMHQEQLEQLRRQQEATQQQTTPAATVDSWQAASPSTPISVGSSSSSTTPWSSSSTYDVYPASASPAFDQQSFLATGAAQTQWTYNNHPTTTAVMTCSSQYQSHEVTVVQRTL